MTGGWFTFLKLAVQLIARVAEIVRDKQLMDAGEARNVAKSLAETAKTLDIGDAAKAYIDGATDAEVDEILKGVFRD